MRSPRLSAVVVGIAVVAVVVAGLAVSRHGHDGPAPANPRGRDISLGLSGDAAALARDHWSRLPRAPIPGRDGPAAVWTGRQMLVWGGSSGRQDEQLHADGAAYNPTTDRWATLPTGPLSGRSEVAAVWTGRQMFLWGGYDGVALHHFHAVADGARFDPAARQWRRLPRSPLSARADALALWTGRNVVVLGGHPAVITSTADVDTDVASYNPATNRWRRLARLAIPRRDLVQNVQAVSTPRGLYAFVGWDRITRRHGSSFSERFGMAVMRYDAAANRWIRTPASDSPRGIGDPLWDGAQIIAPATAPICPGSCPPPFHLNGWRISPGADRWIPIPHGPVDDAEPESTWTGNALLSFDTGASISSGSGGTLYPGAAAAWDPVGNTWTRLPQAPYAGRPQGVAAVWTGRELLMWGEMSRSHQMPDPTFRAVGLRFGPAASRS